MSVFCSLPSWKKGYFSDRVVDAFLVFFEFRVLGAFLGDLASFECEVSDYADIVPNIDGVFHNQLL